LNYSFYLVIKSAHLRKIKAQIENIIWSLCRTTNRIYSIIWYTKQHMKPYVNICYPVKLFFLCGPSQNRKRLFIFMYPICWIKIQSMSLS
jgi:hypothetical protein